jgi:hypothetical protein
MEGRRGEVGTHLVTAASANWVWDSGVMDWAWGGGAKPVLEHALGETIPVFGTRTGERDREIERVCVCEREETIVVAGWWGERGGW